MSLASVASQDHGQSQAGERGWPGGRELRWLYSTCEHILYSFNLFIFFFLILDREGGKQVGRMELAARGFWAAALPLQPDLSETGCRLR